MEPIHPRFQIVVLRERVQGLGVHELFHGIHPAVLPYHVRLLAFWSIGRAVLSS